MSIARSPGPDKLVEDAIARVLAAERDARSAVAQAEADATILAEATRQRIRAIGDRADERIRRARARFEARTAAAVAALDDDATGMTGALTLATEDTVAVERAVATLATSLTTAEPGEDS